MASSMSINWSLLLVIFLVLTVIIVIGAMVIFYIRHWAARHDGEGDIAGKGKYFQQYIPEELKTRKNLQSRQKHKKKMRSVRRLRQLTTALVIAILTLGSGALLYFNRDNLAAKIELTAEDKARLVTTRHEWTRVYPEKLPVLEQQLHSVRQRGLILLGDQSYPDSTLRSRQESARQTWHYFARQHQIETVSCTWEAVPECQKSHPGWIFVVLPDYWQRQRLDYLLYAGASMILYDVPFQLQQQTSGRSPSHYSLYGMHFQRFIDNSYSKLALVGDRELSLGFDAGRILDVGRVSRHYRVHSLKPQAISIDSNQSAGGEIKTRLYAKAVHSGRLVWLDFSPNPEEHSYDLDDKAFNSMIASLFRYLNKQVYQGLATWPEGKRFAAIMEEDTEDKFHSAERVLQFFIENNYPITWYMLSSEAQRHRDLTRELAAAGEVACHGDNHRPFTLSDARTQHERIARCRKVLYEITGKQVFTFRPPEEKFSEHTLDAMMNNGITHFIAEHGLDRFVPVVMQSRLAGSELISIPRMVTDDYELWDRLKADISFSKKLMQQEVDYVEAVGGLYMFSFHTQFMKDDDNFSSVQYLARYLHNKQSYFQTAGMVSQWWKLRSRIVAGEPVSASAVSAFKPVILQVDRNGKLSSSAYSSRLAALSEPIATSIDSGEKDTFSGGE